MPKPTEQQLKNLTKAITEVAEEPVKIEFIDDAYWMFGSEIACLRLEHHYYDTTRARASYSLNLKTWYFKLEVGS